MAACSSVAEPVAVQPMAVQPVAIPKPVAVPKPMVVTKPMVAELNQACFTNNIKQITIHCGKSVSKGHAMPCHGTQNDISSLDYWDPHEAS